MHSAKIEALNEIGCCILLIPAWLIDNSETPTVCRDAVMQNLRHQTIKYKSLQFGTFRNLTFFRFTFKDQIYKML